MKFFFALLACVVCPVAFAAPPPAPSITVAATDIRQLEFNWDPVPGAQRYELWFRSAPGAPWVKYSEHDARRAPLFRIGVSVHLLDWAQASYYIKACNTSGCSASNHVGVASEKLTAMGYIKPKATTGQHFFGSHIALSADGKTLAVLTGEILGTAEDSLVVHVYRMTTPTSGWRREARLLPTYVKARTSQAFLGDNIALSADGNLLVVGSFQEPANRTGLPENAGAVYLFRRTGTEWRLSQKIQGEGRDVEGFGTRVEIDDAARTLVVWHRYHDGIWAPGTLEIYRVDDSDQFVQAMTLPTPPPVSPGDVTECDAISLSGDGNTLLRGCVRDFGAQGATWVYTGADFIESAQLGHSRSGSDLSYDGKVALIQLYSGAEVFRLTAEGWISDGILSEFGGMENTTMRHSAISRDGKIVAFGNTQERTIGLGPLYPPYQTHPDEFGGSGGIVIHQRKASGWEMRRLVKPGSSFRSWAGWDVALGNNGKVLAVGAPYDPSAATGIDGDRQDTSMPERGAVWLY
jgi:hypothetical protein